MGDISRREFVARSAVVAGGAILLSDCSAPDIKTQSKLEGIPMTLPLQFNPSFNKGGGTLAPSSGDDPGPYIDQLGRGCDTVFDELRGLLVTGTQVRSPVSPVEFDVRNGLRYQMIETQSDYYALTRKSARAKGRFGLFRGSGGGSKTSEKTSNSYTLHICALARRVDQSIQLRSDSIRPTSEAQSVIRNERDPDRRLRDWGDTYVSGVIPGSELFLDIQFETSSRTAKTDCRASVSASYGKVASGTGSYSQLISSAKSYKKVTVEIIGLDSTGVPKTFSADEAQKIIERFLAATDMQSTVWAMNLRPVSDLSVGGRRLDWVDYQALRRREAFVAQGESCLAALDIAQSDAEYVRANKAEFDNATFDRASKDLEKIAQARAGIVDIGGDAEADFDNDGKTGAKFDGARMTALVPELFEYIQKEPTPAPAPAPRPKPKPEYRDHDRPHGREG